MKDALRDALDWGKYYPKGTFPPMKPHELKQINEFMKETWGFPLDRLSADILRHHAEVHSPLAVARTICETLGISREMVKAKATNQWTRDILTALLDLGDE